MQLSEAPIDTTDNYVALLDVIFRRKRIVVESKKKRVGHTPWNKKHDFCQVKECGNKHRARGMCISHYSKWRKR